jgi:serine/threonine protein kinase
MHSTLFCFDALGGRAYCSFTGESAPRPPMSELFDELQPALGDSYRVERELAGGMSRVFVEDLRLARKVVLKVLPPELTGSVNVERFEREIRLAARLQHPHIVPLLALWMLSPRP